MSSWVSHLPPAPYWRVVGLGMNAEELAVNAQLDQWIVHDLNEHPHLPLATAEFDGAALCVSIQYLIHPVEVLRDLARVLVPGAPLVITFSNRCFWTKAVRVWRDTDDAGHMALVRRYLEEAGNWSDIQVLDRSPGLGGDPLYAVVARSKGPAEGPATFPVDQLSQWIESLPRPVGPQIARIELTVADREKSRQFYGDFFGFAGSDPRSPTDPLVLRNSGDFVLVLVPGASAPAGPISLGFRLTDPEPVRDLYIRFAARDYEIIDGREELTHVGFKTRDPDGNLIEVYWEP